MKWIAALVLTSVTASTALADTSPVIRPILRPEAAAQSQVAPATPAIPGERRQPAPAAQGPEGTGAGVPAPGGFTSDLRPPARRGNLPRTRWQHRPGNRLWTRSALSALKAHGKPLVDLVPADIDTWCPAYRTAPDTQRRDFWVGFLSALAKHESTYKPRAVGGGGKWYGLLQILPSTARGYKCNVGTGDALMNGSANLSCAVRIMAHTVPRDGVIHGYKGRRGRGVTADWGPMHNAAKRADMARWLRRQTYCKPINATRPRARP